MLKNLRKAQIKTNFYLNITALTFSSESSDVVLWRIGKSKCIVAVAIVKFVRFLQVVDHLLRRLHRVAIDLKSIPQVTDYNDRNGCREQ